MNRWLILALALVAAVWMATGGALVFRFDDLPARVPTHWNLHDQPDGWTPRERIGPMFLLLPATMVGVLLAGALLARVSPLASGIDNFRSAYWYVMFLAVALLAWLQGVTVLAGFEVITAVGRTIAAGLLLFLVLVGPALARTERNYWMGIRTPWTLASARVWHDTHRLAAWLMVGTGLLGFAGMLAGAPVIGCLVAVVVFAAIVPAVYSVVRYRQLARRGAL